MAAMWAALREETTWATTTSLRTSSSTGWWAIEGVDPPSTDDEVFAALDAQDGSPEDKAAVARAWGNPNVAQAILACAERS